MATAQQGVSIGLPILRSHCRCCCSHRSELLPQFLSRWPPTKGRNNNVYAAAALFLQLLQNCLRIVGILIIVLTSQHSAAAAATIPVTVTPTLLQCTASAQLSSLCTNVVVEKSVSLLNGALDYEGVVYINATHVVTIIASGTSPLSTLAPPSTYTTTIFVEVLSTSVGQAASATSTSVASNVQGVREGVVVPTATVVSSVIPPFLDDRGNPWTVLPTTRPLVNITFRKADTKIRFTMQHAAIKSNYPVSEYSFDVPADATMCTTTTGSVGYKCCLMTGSPTTASFYQVYSLSSAVEPVTCTVNASIVYLDHYHMVEVGYAWSPAGEQQLVHRDGVSLVVKGDIRSAVSGLYNTTSSGGGGVWVSRDTGQLPVVSIGADQQLCRKGGYLSNAAQPEPFLVNNWAFGYSARQIGYNITQYVHDRQCNGAPLGYYTSNDSNNSDPFSTWRIRTTTYILAPLTWRNDLVTSSGLISGVVVYFGEVFAMNSVTSPASLTRLRFSPASSQAPGLRPSFITLVVIGAGPSSSTVPLNATHISITHTLELSANPQYYYAASSSSLPSAAASIVSTCACTNTVSPTQSWNTAISAVPSASSGVTTFPLTVQWQWVLPRATLQGSSSGEGGIVCSYRVSRADVNTTPIDVASSVLPASVLLSSLSDDAPSVASLSRSGLVAANVTLMLLYAAVHHMVPPSSTTTQCPLDQYLNVWVGTCDVMSDLLCRARYPTTTLTTSSLTARGVHWGRPLFNSTLQRCAPSSVNNSTTAVLEEQMLQWMREVVLERMYNSTVWVGSAAWGGGPRNVAAFFNRSSAAAPSTPTNSTTSYSAALHITVPPWMYMGTLYVTVNTPTTVCMIFDAANSEQDNNNNNSTAAIASLIIHASHLSFSGKAAVGVVLLVLVVVMCGGVVYVWYRLRSVLPWGDDAARVWDFVQKHRPTVAGVKTRVGRVGDAVALRVSSIWQRWKSFLRVRREEQRREDADQRHRRERNNSHKGRIFVVPTDGGVDEPHHAVAAGFSSRVLAWLRGIGRGSSNGGNRQDTTQQPSRRSSHRSSHRNRPSQTHQQRSRRTPPSSVASSAQGPSHRTTETADKHRSRGAFDLVDSAEEDDVGDARRSDEVPMKLLKFSHSHSRQPHLYDSSQRFRSLSPPDGVDAALPFPSSSTRSAPSPPPPLNGATAPPPPLLNEPFQQDTPDGGRRRQRMMPRRATGDDQLPPRSPSAASLNPTIGGGAEQQCTTTLMASSSRGGAHRQRMQQNPTTAVAPNSQREPFGEGGGDAFFRRRTPSRARAADADCGELVTSAKHSKRAPVLAAEGSSSTRRHLDVRRRRDPSTQEGEEARTATPMHQHVHSPEPSPPPLGPRASSVVHREEEEDRLVVAARSGKRRSARPVAPPVIQYSPSGEEAAAASPRRGVVSSLDAVPYAAHTHHRKHSHPTAAFATPLSTQEDVSPQQYLSHLVAVTTTSLAVGGPQHAPSSSSHSRRAQQQPQSTHSSTGGGGSSRRHHRRRTSPPPPSELVPLVAASNIHQGAGVGSMEPTSRHRCG